MSMFSPVATTVDLHAFGRAGFLFDDDSSPVLRWTAP